jgi:hypothetical protein
LILSSNLFHILADFEVLPFNPIFSDVHNQIHFSLYFAHSKSNTQDSVNENNTYVGWNSNKADDFTQLRTSSIVIDRYSNFGNAYLSKEFARVLDPGQIVMSLEHLAQCRGGSSLNTWHSAEMFK